MEWSPIQSAIIQVIEKKIYKHKTIVNSAKCKTIEHAHDAFCPLMQV